MGCVEGSHQTITPLRPTHSIFRVNSMLTEGKEGSQPTQSPYYSKLTSDLLTRTLNKPMVNSPDVQQFQKMFTDSGNDINVFFQSTQQRISDLYISLSKQTLELMQEKKLSHIESKIYISEQILYTSMNILKAIGIKTNFKNDSEIIHKLNSLQLSMIGYMKAKYPRSGQSFVPGELMQQFKNFDFTEQPDNDILKSMKIHFGDENEKKLTLQVKRFINKIIRQIDQKSTAFQNLLSERVFVVEKQGKPYTVSNKIGRKIPQNVQKFVEQQDTPIELRSPQIFRVIVKWVNDMEDYILHPEQQIKQKDNYKTYTNTGSEQIFDSICSDELEVHIKTFQDHLTSQKKQYEKQLEELKNYIELFNHNLLRVLTRAQRKQKYVPRRQAQIIKYSMFNTKLLSWMLIQKLMIVLKKLIKTSTNLKQHIGIQLDLIKFNVTDLLRSMMIGNKFQILKVFQNLKKLELQNKLRIIRIKNRLETPLNDVMIIFKMSQSFLICQLQIILSDGNQSASDKLKNIEMLNHFFYELDRSPYGVMAQVAALLGFKDNKTAFEQKITFQNILENNLNKCFQIHPKKIQILSVQKKPFICSQCTTYYNQNQNEFIHKICKQCNLYLCMRCIMLQKNQDIKKFYYDTIFEKLRVQLCRVTDEQNLYIRINHTNDMDALKLAQFADSEQVRVELRNYFDMQMITPLRQLTNKQSIITFKQIQKHVESYIEKKKSSEVIKNLYITIGKFVNGQLQFYSMKWDELDGVNYCFTFGAGNQSKDIKFRYFDFLIIHDTKLKSLPANELSQEANIKMFKNYSLPNIDRDRIELKHISLIRPQRLKVCQVYLTIDAQIKQDVNNSKKNNYKKNFKYESIQGMRKNLPELLQTQEVYNLSNEGIQTEHLDYFKRVQWKQNVKFLNLHDNMIDNIDVILANLVNIEKLMVSKNFITKINFSVNLLKLKKFIAFSNYIQQVKGLDKIPNITNINMFGNRLQSFDIRQIKFPELRVLQLHENTIRQLGKVNFQNCPKLTTVSLQGLHDQINSEREVQIRLNLPYLSSLDFKVLSVKSFLLENNSNIQYLRLEDFFISDFNFQKEPKNLKKMNLTRCYDYTTQIMTNLSIKNVFINLFEKQYPELIQLSISQSWGIEKLPILKMPKLKKLTIFYVIIKDISNLAESNLISLEELSISKTSMKTLPLIRCPFVKNINIEEDDLQNVQNVQKWEVPQLQNLFIRNLAPQTQIPLLDKLRLKQCVLSGGVFKEGSNFASKTIQKLTLIFIDCKYLPKLSLPNILQLQLQSCKSVNLANFQGSSMQRLKTINGRYLQLSQDNLGLPIINFPSLQSLSLPGCNISNIDNISLSKIQNLKTLDLQTNTIRKLPVLNLPKVNSINFSNCNVQDMTNLQFSNLSQLTTFYCQNNQFKKFPILHTPKLSSLYMSNCQITQMNGISLSNLQSLQSLDLNYNNISAFSAANLPKLKTLNMNWLMVKNIQQLSNSVLNQLKSLDLSHIQLDILSLPILKIQNLTSLNISNSNIQNINNLTLSDLPSLKQLDLSASAVKILPVLNLKSLQLLRANSTAVKKVQSIGLESVLNLELSDLPQLQRLELEENNIQALPKLNLKKLKFIYLTGNKITDLTEFNKSNLPNFQLINIYENKINLIPVGKNLKPLSIYMKHAQVTNFNQMTEHAIYLKNFFYNSSKMPQSWPDLHFKAVKIFQLQQNQIQNADQILRNEYPQVNQLTLVDNKLSKAPLIKAPKLTKLYLNRNCIKDVRDLVRSNLPSLSMLSLESNQILDLVDMPFTNLGQLYLSHNQFTDMSCLAKREYPNMRMLVLYDIKIKQMCKLNMPSLQKLWVNVNQIESIQGIKGSVLPKLTLVNFESNKISDISPLNFIKADSLQSIYMKNNKVKKLPQLGNLKKLTLINLSQNPIENVDQFVKTKYESLYTFYYSTNCDDTRRSQIDEQLRNAGIYGLYHSQLIKDEQ